MAMLPRSERLAMRTRVNRLKSDTSAPRTETAAVEYTSSLVTFFDILGFRNRVMTHPAAEMHEILHVLQESANVDRSQPTDPRMVAFSDNIVRAVPIPDAETLPANTLLGELIDVLYAQLTLALMGVFVRGGMSVGGLYVDEAKIFGPGLVRSYDLETNFATYPRVVLDPDLIGRVAASDVAEGTRISVDQLTVRGDDGVFFGDYLNLLAVAFEPDEMHAKIVEHKAAIISNVESLPAGSFSRAKLMFTWLARYHNAFCGRVGHDGEGVLYFEDLGLSDWPFPP